MPLRHGERGVYEHTVSALMKVTLGVIWVNTRQISALMKMTLGVIWVNTRQR